MKNTTGTTISIRWKYRGRKWKGLREILQDKSLNFINIAKLDSIQITGIPMKPSNLTVQEIREVRTVAAEVLALSILKNMACKKKKNVRMRLTLPEDEEFARIGMGFFE